MAVLIVRKGGDVAFSSAFYGPVFNINVRVEMSVSGASFQSKSQGSTLSTEYYQNVVKVNY